MYYLLWGERDLLDSKRSGGFTPSERDLLLHHIPLPLKLRKQWLINV